LTRLFNRKFFFTIFLLTLMLTPGIHYRALALDSEEINNIHVYEQAAPAVVTVSVSSDEGPSSGAGAIISSSGIILTSSHVLGEACNAKIKLESGEEYPAKLLARIGQKADLALLKIQVNKPLPFIHLGNSQALKVGQKVLAIGNPYGFERTLTIGIISRIDKERNRIQTDASINPGNSGGPLLNTDGEIIGINQSIFNPDGRRTNIGIGFAVPADTAKDFIREIAELPNLRHQTAELPDEVESPADPTIPVLLKEFSNHL
jgi:S1-C subfamily serine protease